MGNSFCLVSENDISREGLSFIMRNDGMEVSGCYRDISEIPPELLNYETIVVIDAPDAADQPAAVERVKSLHPKASVVVLADAFDISALLACYDLGARGYIVVKSMKALPLTTSLRLAGLGQKIFPSDVLDMLDRKRRETSTIAAGEQSIDEANLSRREFDVLCCLMAGYSNKVIARQLDVCEATVKVHVKAILRKLKVRNRTQAAIWANARGMPENSLVS